MRLSSGMEAWPGSRLGDNSGKNSLGTVSHIRPVVPKPQHTTENTRERQAATHTIRTGSTQQTEGSKASRRYPGHHSMASTRQATETGTANNDTGRAARMECHASTSHAEADTTLWFRRVK